MIAKTFAPGKGVKPSVIMVAARNVSILSSDITGPAGSIHGRSPSASPLTLLSPAAMTLTSNEGHNFSTTGSLRWLAMVPGGQMIARIWRGWAPLATADDYQRHYETEVREHLRAVNGFRGARLLRSQNGQEVMFTSITFFASLDAVRGFAGDDYDVAVVEDAARRALSCWDGRVSHHEVVAELG